MLREKKVPTGSSPETLTLMPNIAQNSSKSIDFISKENIPQQGLPTLTQC
jgi:hypothetical protein